MAIAGSQHEFSASQIEQWPNEHRVICRTRFRHQSECRNMNRRANRQKRIATVKKECAASFLPIHANVREWDLPVAILVWRFRSPHHFCRGFVIADF
jgi:hypothetical protein